MLINIQLFEMVPFKVAHFVQAFIHLPIQRFKPNFRSIFVRNISTRSHKPPSWHFSFAKNHVAKNAEFSSQKRFIEVEKYVSSDWYIPPSSHVHLCVSRKTVLRIGVIIDRISSECKWIAKLCQMLWFYPLYINICFYQHLLVYYFDKWASKPLHSIIINEPEFCFSCTASIEAPTDGMNIHQNKIKWWERLLNQSTAQVGNYEKAGVYIPPLIFISFLVHFVVKLH